MVFQQQVIRVYSLPDGTFSSDEEEEEEEDEEDEEDEGEKRQSRLSSVLYLGSKAPMKAEELSYLQLNGTSEKFSLKSQLFANQRSPVVSLQMKTTKGWSRLQ